MSETETAVPMDDKALFDSALAPEAPAEAVAQEAPAEQSATDQPRDEHGRFAPKTPAEEAAQAQEPVTQPVQQEAPKVEAKQEPPPGWIPAWRAREIADAKTRSLEEQLRKFTEKQEPIDPYVDPQKFRDQGIQEATTPLVQQLAGTREYYSRELAVLKHGQQTVVDAYNWLAQASNNGDPKVATVLQRAMQSIDPFGEIVTAFKRDRAISTVGDDPQAWFQKQLQEAAKDPAKRQELMAVLGEQQQPNTQANSQQTNIVRLPPSLNRQPGAAGNAAPGSISDADLYRHAIS